MRRPRSSHVPYDDREHRSVWASARLSPAGLPKTVEHLPLLGGENLSNCVPQAALLLFEARTAYF